MRSQLFRWLLTASLMGGTLVAISDQASAQPTVRDHRKKPRPQGTIVAPPPVVIAQPREAPPAPREERIVQKGRGWVWVSGHWEWRNGKWDWQAGHWEKAKKGKKWRDRKS